MNRPKEIIVSYLTTIWILSRAKAAMHSFVESLVLGFRLKFAIAFLPDWKKGFRGA